MDKIALSTQLINGILKYLDGQPHGAVRPLIDAIIKEAEAQGATAAQSTPVEQQAT